MQCSNGKIRAVVRSTRVPVGMTTFSLPGSIATGQAGATSVRSVIFANVLDESQRRIVDEARRVARASNLELEVVDLARQNPVRRALSRLVRGDHAPISQGIRLEVKSLADIETAFNSSIN